MSHEIDHSHWNTPHREWSTWCNFVNVHSWHDHIIFYKTLVICQGNAAAVDSLFGMYHVFDKILFDYLKAYHQISPKWGMEKCLRAIDFTCSILWFTRFKCQIPNKLKQKDPGKGYQPNLQWTFFHYLNMMACIWEVYRNLYIKY